MPGACLDGAVVRSASPSLTDLGVEVVDGVDVTDDDAVSQLGQKLKGRVLHRVINNAGILKRETLDNLDFNSIRKQFEVNALGPLRLTAALLGSLNPGAKVAIITSRMGSIGDNTSGGRYGYRMSKAAVNMAAVSLAHDLRPRGIHLAILHPGYVRTDMTGHTGLIDADASVSGLIARMDALDAHNSGTFWHQNGDVLPW